MTNSLYIKEYYYKKYMTEDSANDQKFVTGKPKWGGAPPEKRRSPWRYNEETGK